MGDTVYIYIFFPHKSKSMQLELENCFKKKKNTHLKEAQCTRTSQLDHFMFIETVAVFSALFHGLRCITAQICTTIINVVRSVYLCLFMLFLKKFFFYCHSLRICGICCSEEENTFTKGFPASQGN